MLLLKQIRGVMVLEDIFVIFGCLFALSIIVGQLWIFRLKNPIVVSNYTTSVSAFLILYSLFAFLLAFRVPNISLKILMLFFATSPLIYYKIRNYKYERVYFLFQFFFIILSVLFVFWYF